MNRRDLLVRSGTLAAAGVLAGCLESAPSDSEDERPEGDGSTERGDSPTPEGPAEIADRSFASGGADCGSANEADVEFEDGSVTISGKLAVPDPCHEAALGDVEYDESDLRVTVIAEGRQDADACIQCLAEADYEFSMSFVRGLPDAVTVVHDGAGDPTTVETATR